MPGPIVHLIVQQRLRAALNALPGGSDYAGLLNTGQCSPYTAFGSIGPDFLFFTMREYGDPLADLVNFMFKAYDAFEPIISFYETYVQPVEATIEDAVTNIDETLFQGLFGDLKATANMLSSTAHAAVASVVVDNVDLFYPFYPKIQKGLPETDWYWFDFLHYRRTGAFASMMWDIAGSDTDLRRYVIGYTSHIGTDVVGHPFVNAIVGGPYRSHWHRHKLVENWIDAYARNWYTDLPSTKNCLNLQPGDTYIPNAISGSLYYRLTEFPGKRLPDKLKKMFTKAMQTVYGSIPHPPMLFEDDVDAAYRLWQAWFERSTTIGDAQPPTPIPPPGSGAASLVNDYVSGFPPFPGGGSAPGGPGGGGGFSIKKLFKAILDFVDWVASTVSYTGSWIISHAHDILSLPFAEAIGLVKWLLYQIRKGLWEVYDNLRFILVLGGYIFPEPRDLSKNPWGNALLNTDHAHLTGGPHATFAKYPLKQESHGLFGTTEHHLVYPDTVQEQPYAEPMPMPFMGQDPRVFIDQSHPYNAYMEHLYDSTAPYGSGAQVDRTHDVDQQTWNTAQFGNAIDFSARLIVQRIAKLPNFNLDGDRGYGWKTWRADDPVHIETSIIVPVQYIDF